METPAVARVPRARLEYVVRARSPGTGVRVVRFLAVGTVGYGVNLAVFAALVGQGTHPLLAATASFAVAVAVNYLLNRAWTFQDARGAFLAQGGRCASVALAALGCNLAVLHVLVLVGAGKIAAQSIGIAVAAPVNFLGNRLWAFRAPAAAAAPAHAPGTVRAAIPLRIHLTAERAAAYRTVFVWWGASRALVLGTALAVQALGWPRRRWYPSVTRHPFALLGSWDGRWYRMVAERGYLVVPHHQSDTAFFPLFPVLLAALHRTGLSLDAAGIALGSGGLLVGLAALYELVRTWLPQDVAVRAATYPAVFPVGYVFSMVYPEGLVVAAMALAALFAVRGRWGWSAVATAVAAFARPEALLLVLPLFVLARRHWRLVEEKSRWQVVAAVAAAPAAIAGVALYDWHMFGQPLAFSTAQRAWGRRFSLAGIGRAVAELAHATHAHNGWLYRDAAFCLLYLVLLAVALRAGVPRSWVLAGALIVLLPLETGSFTSDARFGLLALPVYAGLGAAGSRPWLDRAMRAGSVVLLVAATATILMRWP